MMRSSWPAPALVLEMGQVSPEPEEHHPEERGILGRRRLGEGEGIAGQETGLVDDRPEGTTEDPVGSARATQRQFAVDSIREAEDHHVVAEPVEVFTEGRLTDVAQEVEGDGVANGLQARTCDASCGQRQITRPWTT